MAKGSVFVGGIFAGTLEKKENGVHEFRYDTDYYQNPAMPAVSLTLPKTQLIYESPVLFSFFYGLLAEGVNKDIQCRLLRIDEEDDFTRLLKTAGEDTIGAVTVKEIES